MIEFSAGNGPDSRAVAIMLEEAEQDYELHPCANDAPAIVIQDTSAQSSKVSGLPDILQALARHARRFQPEHTAARAEALDLVQWGADRLASSPDPDTHKQHLQSLEQALSATRYLVGEDISIADFCIYPLVEPLRGSLSQNTSPPMPSLADWIDRLSVRPALARGYHAIG